MSKANDIVTACFIRSSSESRQRVKRTEIRDVLEQETLISCKLFQGSGDLHRLGAHVWRASLRDFLLKLTSGSEAAEAQDFQDSTLGEVNPFALVHGGLGGL